MSWPILISISVFLYSFSVILQRILLKDEKTEPISFAIFFQLGVAVVTAILVLLFVGKITLPNLSEISWNVLLMTVLYALANVFLFKSLKTIEASRFAVIFSSKTLFAVLGVTIFLNEGLRLIQWVGALLILAGVVTVSIKRLDLKIGKGDLFAFVAAILFGLANTNDRLLVGFFNPYSYVVLGFVLPAILMSAFYPKSLLKMTIYFRRRFVNKMLLLCAMYGQSAVTFLRPFRPCLILQWFFQFMLLLGY